MNFTESIVSKDAQLTEEAGGGEQGVRVRRSAQHVESTETVVVRDALTPEDCEALASMGGRVSEGRGFAHMVLYLHQQQLLERTNPALWAKLLGIMREHGPAGPLTEEEVTERAMAEADGTAEDRGAAAAAERAAERAGLNVRCAELHTYAEGGGLGDAGHRDKGSTLTMSVLLSHFSTDSEGMQEKGGHMGGQVTRVHPPAFPPRRGAPSRNSPLPSPLPSSRGVLFIVCDMVRGRGRGSLDEAW